MNWQYAPDKIQFDERIYSLNFAERNFPEVLFVFPDMDWSLLQLKLACF